MKLGQRVRWESSGGGNQTTKIGEVVRILKSGDAPWKIGHKEFPNHQLMFDGWGLPGGKNTQTAYLVEVIKSPRAKPRLYMPFPFRLMKD
ncbi:MAG: hypothetical protein IMF11_15240 [Proteobacteria bacterium]|nr:hypothetical protein [Pseudomonadota bacterium]